MSLLTFGKRDLVLLVELFALFLLVPLAIWLQWLAVPLVIIPLYVLMLFALLWLHFRQHINPRQLWRGESLIAEKAALKAIAMRFLFVVIAVWLVVYVFFPDKLFSFPARHPFLWLLFLLLYPVFSVYPQEVLYRAFFFRRYAEIFGDKDVMIIASTLFFVFMHIVFGNGIVILSTLLGGYFFADTYARTGSLRVVCLEHALYGSVIFTLGLGEFFMFGVVKSFFL